jgi:uncharacterized protein (DUF1697 family)
MNTYMALLRGINVGGKNSLPMKELVEIFTSHGFVNVKTYIQSGNVVFQSPGVAGDEVAESLAQAIERAKGFRPRILILDEGALLRAIENNPYPTDAGKALHFYFLDSAPEQPNMDRLETLKAPSEAFVLTGNVFYLYAPDGIGRSKLAPAVEAALGVPATARNWNTVAKLASMVAEP